MIEPKRVGELKCQAHPYLKQFSTRVATCVKLQEKVSIGIPFPADKNIYEVELEDTILFPEGGGQPCDLGSINDTPVYAVARKGLRCIHYTGSLFDVGSSVDLKVNFERRWDHMQQHSGQHLLSAVFEKLYDLDTTSWLLGDSKCYIELPISSRKLTKDMLKNVERECNKLISDALLFSVESFDLSNPTVERPSSIPDDYTDGIIRYICIDGYDRNPCCGTHMDKTSRLQVVKLLNVENNGIDSLRLFFNFGDRVVAQLQASFDRDLEINTLLSTRPEEFAAKITLLKQQSRDATKQLKKLSGELAQISIQQAISDLEKETVVAVYKTGVDSDFVKVAQIALKPWINKHGKEDAEPKALILSACNGSESSGPVVVFGHPQLIPKVVEYISETGSLKGAMAGGNKWQGKSAALPALYKSLASISSNFNDTSKE